MKKLNLFSLTSLVLVLGLLAVTSCKKENIEPVKDIPVNVLSKSSFTAFDDAMHKLWADHMTWTYTTVDAFFNNTDALNQNLTRLLQNQIDIGDAIKPYYGEEAGNQLADLLTEHIQLAVPVLTAAKDGDQTALGIALDDWYQNAEDIGNFLADANPKNFDRMMMVHMMRMHIDQTTAYSVDLLGKNYDSAIVKFDEAFSHMTEMAHDLAVGIAKQFPNKF
ncbi:MAG: hypothetical protein M9897_13105 [Brumimicrobium sp.]|nr:hypothetical protein [Brumimicrobium sp.]